MGFGRERRKGRVLEGGLFPWPLLAGLERAKM